MATVARRCEGVGAGARRSQVIFLPASGILPPDSSGFVISPFLQNTVMTFGEMPPPAQEASDGCPSGQKMADDAIAHASLRINNGELMLSDSAFGPDVHYAGFTLVLDPSDVAEGQRWFDALAVGGRIEMAWQETFWAHGFGKVVDRFGVPWMINVVKQG